MSSHCHQCRDEVTRKEKEAICRRLNDPDGLAISLANQAKLLAFNASWTYNPRKSAFKQSRPAEGLPLAEEALRIATAHGLSALARRIEPIVNQIRGLLE